MQDACYQRIETKQEPKLGEEIKEVFRARNISDAKGLVEPDKMQVTMACRQDIVGHYVSCAAYR